nr:P-loop NTPase fold protein [uncultured Ilyobacter sp.]
MQIKRRENSFTIDDMNPFKNDKLGRETIADNLTKIIDSIHGSFVLGIDSSWGTGKTTFIKMWQKKIELNEDYFAIYFNAWENDFFNNSLISLIGEIDKHLKNGKNAKLSDLKEVTGTIASNVVKKLTFDIFNPKEMYKELNSTEVRKLLDQYINYLGIKGNLAENLKLLKEKLGVKKIIFFIDELDRCRPDYAIEILEKIKHIFDVEDYIFVLALDKSQLSHSVGTLYGDKMDSLGYLRRFIDLDYSLPKPDKEAYIKVLIDEFELKAPNGNDEYLWKFLIEISKKENISLRDLDKLFYYLKILLPITKLWDASQKLTESLKYVLGMLYSLFIYLKIKEPELYNGILNKEFNYGDVVKVVENIKLDIRNVGFNKFIPEIIKKILEINNSFVNFDPEEEYTIFKDFNHQERINLITLFENDGKFKILNEMEFLNDFQ